MAGTTIYRTAVLPEWIDFNGHLRDAYYVVALSTSIDALMDRLGLDASYRERTRCTLYTLEMHMHWRHEVKAGAALEIDALVLGADAKRLHLGCDVRVPPGAEPVATAEFMLLHVRQGAAPVGAPFPPAAASAIAALAAAYDGVAWPGPRSRALTLARR